MQKILAEFLKRVRTCEGINESLPLERFSTYLRGLSELQDVIAAIRGELQGHVAPPELNALEKEVTQFMDRWETEWEQFLANPPCEPIMYFEFFPDWRPLQHDIEKLVGRCRELMATVARTAGVPFDTSQFMDIRERYGTVPRRPPVKVPKRIVRDKRDKEEEP